MTPQECPRCELISSPGAPVCDCGYDFQTASPQNLPPTDKQLRSESFSYLAHHWKVRGLGRALVSLVGGVIAAITGKDRIPWWGTLIIVIAVVGILAYFLPYKHRNRRVQSQTQRPD